jgi:membrane protein
MDPINPDTSNAYRSLGKERGHPPIVDVFKEIYEIWISERPGQLAAALAYFGLFSFAPVIYIALSLAGVFVDQAASLERFLNRLETVFGQGVSQAVQHLLNTITVAAPGGSLIGSLASFLFVLLAASGVFYQLQFAMNTVWKVPITRKGALRRTVREYLFSFLMVIGLGLLLVLGAVISLVSNWIGSIAFLSGFLPSLTRIGFIVLATLVFGAMYKLLPGIKIAWRDVWAGAAAAALLIAGGGWLVIFFIRNIASSSALEATASFILLLIGFYYFAQIFLLGAILTRVYAYRYGSMYQQPASNVEAQAERLEG